MSDEKSNIYIGPAGWSYKDWNGIVYPPKRSKNFNELQFLKDYFNLVEINSTFYRKIDPGTIERWVSLVKGSDRFKFTVKLWQKFTHSNEKPTESDVQDFQIIFSILTKANLLGAVLVQFPWSFKNNKTSLEKIDNIRNQFDFPLVVEFRHSSWNDSKIYKYLESQKIGFVNVDQPVIGKSVKPDKIVTSDIGYVRLHGRNYSNWFNEKSGRDERYNYLYNKDEMTDWITNIREISNTTNQTFVVFNNHFKGQAIVNGFECQEMLYQQPPIVPAHLKRFYPSLAHMQSVGNNENFELF